MKDCTELPDGYKEIYRIDLVNNKTQFIIVNVINIAAGILMLPAGIYIRPDMFGGPVSSMPVMLAGIWIYIILHELVHGIFMKAYSGIKPVCGFKLFYAYAGSTAYFSKTHYIIIALAPVVIWGIVLAALNPPVPKAWFRMVYFVRTVNVSGAAGDLYVTWLMMKMPEDIPVNDTGVAMTVYSQREPAFFSEKAG